MKSRWTAGLIIGILFLGLMSVLSQASGLRRKVLMIIAPENFQDEELFVTKRTLESRGIKVWVASTRRGIATGMRGSRFQVNLSLGDVNPETFDALVLVGGSGARVFWEDYQLHKFVRRAYRRGAVVAAICISPITLCKAGLLRNRRVTVWGGVSRRLRSCGARYTGKVVEVDGRIVTANGPFAAKAFANAILRLLGYM